MVVCGEVEQWAPSVIKHVVGLPGSGNALHIMARLPDWDHLYPFVGWKVSKSSTPFSDIAFTGVVAGHRQKRIVVVAFHEEMKVPGANREVV